MGKSNVVFGHPFFLAVCNTKIDNTLESEGLEMASTTEADAIRYARGEVEEHGMEFVIYHCTPVVRVDPLPRSKVVRLDADTPTPETSDEQ